VPIGHLFGLCQQLGSLCLRELRKREEQLGLIVLFGEEIRQRYIQRLGQRRRRVHVRAVYLLLVAVDQDAAVAFAIRHEPSQRALREATQGASSLQALGEDGGDGLGQLIAEVTEPLQASPKPFARNSLYCTSIYSARNSNSEMDERTRTVTVPGIDVDLLVKPKRTEDQMKRIHSCVWICVALGLAGCGGGEIDYRQTNTVNGLVYKNGDAEPFTGRVLKSPMSVNIFRVGTCDIEVKKGVLDGKTICSTNDGKKIAEANYSKEMKDGAERRWSPDTGKLIYDASWSSGKIDGVEKVFNDAGDTLIHETHWKKGNRNGSEKIWETSGKVLLADLNWINGNANGHQRTSTEDMTWKNGRKDGPYKHTSDLGEVFEEGQYADGKKVGIWNEFGPSASFELLDAENLGVESFKAMEILGIVKKAAAKATVSYIDDQRDGPIKVLDAGGHVIFEGAFANDKFNGQIVAMDFAHNRTVRLNAVNGEGHVISIDAPGEESDATNTGAESRPDTQTGMGLSR